MVDAVVVFFVVELMLRPQPVFVKYYDRTLKVYPNDSLVLVDFFSKNNIKFLSFK